MLAPIFESFEGYTLTVLKKEDGSAWFLAKELADPLSIGSDAVRHRVADLEDSDKGVILIHTPGGPQKMTFVSESGALQIIVQSRKPEARRLRKWVCDLAVRFAKGEPSTQIASDPALLAEVAQMRSELGSVHAKLDGIMLGIAASRRPAPTRKRNENPRPQSAGYLSVNKWFDTNLLIGEGEVPAMTAYNHYCDWSNRQGQKPASMSILGRALTSLGVSKRHTRECMMYEGVQLLQILGSRL